MFHIGLKYAIAGLIVALKTERNIKIHFCAACFVVILGILTEISTVEWAIIFLTIGSVISMELINTSLERALDYIEPNNQQAIGIAKDLAAAAVLISAIISVFVACCIFLPKWI
ncbi:diacylglycerol kinase family protein [Gracilibacillus sp. YIM 98692]|uniref:diacylglycerol kinase family protein n=1 Tax=Gracilibacillus sp. YIM 98692 TaxID=2663532 RepID=UPI0013CF9DE0|nr:diacylglycerol kinase family protein [Gracilibacillus sp. YIM 98692]